MAKRVLVTGCSGYLGEVLVRSLLAHPQVDKVVAVDVRPPTLPAHPRFMHRKADIRDEFFMRSLMQDEGIDTIFHLAYMPSEPGRAVLAKAVNVDGALSVLDAAAKCPKVRRMVVTSSSSAYGGRWRAPDFITEEQPLRARRHAPAVHKRLVEAELAKAVAGLRAGLEVTVLRLCTVVGPSERADGPVRSFLKLPFGVSLPLRAGKLQFLAESDLARVMIGILEAPRFSGTYNVAPDDYTTVGTLCRRLGKRHLRLPYVAIRAWIWVWRTLRRPVPISENLLAQLAHPVILSNRKLKSALGVEIQLSSEDAFLDCARSCGRPLEDLVALRSP